MNFETMTEKLQKILIKALTVCKDNQNPELSDEHLMKAFLEDDDVCSILTKLNTNINPLINYTNDMIEKLLLTIQIVILVWAVMWLILIMRQIHYLKIKVINI